jgi:hypothetical protein
MFDVLYRFMGYQKYIALDNFVVKIVGPCIDGETTYKVMKESIISLNTFDDYEREDYTDGRRLVGAGACTLTFVNELDAITKKIMMSNKTPRILIRAHSGLLDAAFPPSDDKSDVFGNDVTGWVTLPKRHHVDKDGNELPPSVIPSHWPTTIVNINGYMLHRFFKYHEEQHADVGGEVAQADAGKKYEDKTKSYEMQRERDDVRNMREAEGVESK